MDTSRFMLFSISWILSLHSFSNADQGRTTDVPAWAFNYSECRPNATGQADVPKLSKKFTIKIEGKTDLADGRSPISMFDSEGFYEEEGQRGATIVHQHGIKSVFLYDFISGRAYDIEGTVVIPKLLT